MNAQQHFDEMRSDPRNADMTDDALWHHAEMRARGDHLKRLKRPEQVTPDDGVNSLKQVAADMLARIEEMPDDPEPGPEPEQKKRLVFRKPGLYRFSGCFEPDLLNRCKESLWNGYEVDNVPGGMKTLRVLGKRLLAWLNDPIKTQFIFLTGLQGRGKTYLAHLLAYRALGYMANNEARATYVRDSELRIQLDALKPELCGYNYHEDRPRSPIEAWVQRAGRVIIVDELGAAPEEYNKPDRWLRTFLELLTLLKESRIPRLVIFISNISARDFERWEISLRPKSLNKSAPISSRLLAHDVIQLELGNKDGGRDFRREPPEPPVA